MPFTPLSIGARPDICQQISQPSSRAWIRVSRREPCPVCGKPDNCTVSRDGGAVWCGREAEFGGRRALRQNAGGQWLHLLRDRPEWTPPPPPRPRKLREGQRAGLSVAKLGEIVRRAAGRGLPELVKHLGVDVLAELDALGVGWLSKSELVELEPWQLALKSDGLWCVPFRDSAGRVLGVQTRSPDGDKKSLAGGKLGLVFRDDFSTRPGGIWMPEGMSDAVSLASLGLAVVGRPSNAAGADLLVELLAELGPERDLVVVADRDAPKANGRDPGRDGAVSVASKIAAELSRPVRVVYPPPGPWKDARAWLAAHPNATAADWTSNVELIHRIDAPRDCTSQPAGDVVSLDAWRAELADAKVSLATSGAVGVYLDRSPTGAGKSHSDALAFRAAGGGLSVQPTHANCEEVETDLRSRGIDAAAAPEWIYQGTHNLGDGKGPPNCWHHEALTAREMGLPIQAAACVACPHRSKSNDGDGRCDDVGYLGQLAAYKLHAVRIVTHARAAFEGLDAVAAGLPVVSIHENALPVVRPGFTFHLADVENARDVVRRILNEPGSLNSMTEEQREILGSLADGIDALAAAVDAPPGPVRMPIVENFRPVVRRLFVLSRRLQRGIDWSGVLAAFSPKSAGVSCSEQVHRERGGVKVQSRSFHLVHRNPPPENALTIVSDATADLDALSRAVGSDVREITPSGRLLEVHRVRQVHRDVTRQTTGETVVKLVAGRLATHPEWQRVGLVCLKDHRRALENWQAAGGLGSRIHRIGHFGAGDARGSNRFIAGDDAGGPCDAVLVVGTPRIPALGVRQELAARGHHDAAAAPEPEWVPIPWAGLSETGERVTVAVNGYADELWETTRRGMVRAELRQAIGRARANLPGGIPVEVLSNEETGCELSDGSLSEIGLGDGPRRLLDHMVRVYTKSVKNPYRDLQGKFTDFLNGSTVFGAAELAAAVGGESPRNVRNWLYLLERRGLVVRRGGGAGRSGVSWGLVAGAVELSEAGGGASRPGDLAEPSPVGLVTDGRTPSVESSAEPLVGASVGRPWTCKGEPWANQPKSWAVQWQD